MNNYYNLCRRYQGQVVNIRCRDGKRHVGRVVRVTPTHVYIQPVASRNLGGFGYGWGGFGYRPWGWGAAYAIPLAFIAGIALGGLWW